MKTIVYSLFILSLFALACKKKEPASEPAPDPTPLPVNPLPDCGNLPAAPSPFGWKDSTISEDENVNLFRANPIYPRAYLYRIIGKVFPQNRLYFYNYLSGERKFISENVSYIPQTNANGWMVFCKTDQNIYKAKLNGDSLIQLTNNSLCSDPKWDYTGKFIYCYQAANGSNPSNLLKLNRFGQLASFVPIEFPNTVPSKNSDKLYYLKTQSNQLSIFLWDQAANTETLVFNSNKPMNGAQNDFFDLNIDNNEAYLYWSNSSGVLRLNLQNKAVDTLLKNCPNYTFLNPIVSENCEELTFSVEVLKPLNSVVLFREYRTFELNLKTKQWRELKFFPK